MKIGIPIFDCRISPVFDYSTHLEVIEIEGGVEAGSRGIVLDGMGISERVKVLRNAGVDVLICAGLCKELSHLLESMGIKVISGIIGARDDVLGAYLRDELDDPRFVMPGCWRKRRMRGRGRYQRSYGNSYKQGKTNYEGSHHK
jgi:predicted Fe-Mo cluster-binding NifX family protein